MADSSVPITAGTGTPIRVLTGLGPSVAGQQVFALADAFGTLAVADPDGTTQVDGGPSTLLLDTFDTTLGNWVTGGTAPTISGGNLVTNESVTASATSFLRTVGAFALQGQAYLYSSFLLAIEGTATANNSRWWGYGTNAATPSATAPITNGVVFMLDSANAGVLEAVKYVAGVKTVLATLTRPTDGLIHKYAIWFKQSTTYFQVDGVTVATAPFVNLAVTTNQNLIIGSANTATAPAAHTFQITSASISDTGENNQTISDSIAPWIRSTVKSPALPASAIAATTDNGLLTTAMPFPSLTATATAATGVAATLTLAAAGAGLRHYLTSVTWEQYCTAATTGSATPIVSTAANTSLVSTFSTALVIGQVVKDVRMFASPIATTAQNTATSFTLPLTTGIIWRVTATYFIAP